MSVLKRSKLPMPYLSKLQGNVQPGQSIFIKGHLKGGRFDITLHTGPNVAGANRDNIALVLSGRVDDNKFVLNTYKNGEWGKEERHKFNLKKDEDFDLRIRCHAEGFEVWSEGKDVATYEYRIPLIEVNHIYVVGEIDLYRCSWEGRYYPVPFQTAVPQGAIKPGALLYIAGVVDKKADRFEIDLKSANDFVLHINPRLKEKHIIRNSCRGGVWDDVDEREIEGDFPFEKGHAFDMVVEVEPEHYKLYVDGKPIATYRHRLPLDSVDNLVIEGDIDIQGVHW